MRRRELPSGEEFFLGVVDDFEREIEQLNASSAFQELLRERAKEEGTPSVNSQTQSGASVTKGPLG